MHAPHAPRGLAAALLMLALTAAALPAQTLPPVLLDPPAPAPVPLALPDLGATGGDAVKAVLVERARADAARILRERVAEPAGVGASVAWSVEGDVAGRELGDGATTIGDVNLDGYSDVVATGRNGASFTALYVFLGGPGGPTLAPGFPVTNLPSGGEVNAAGDVNGDGRPDAVMYWPVTGRVRVYFGTATGLDMGTFSEIFGFYPSDNFGFHAATAGDVNGDGYDEIIVGSPFGTAGSPCGLPGTGGRADLFYGSASGISASSLWSLYGCQTIGGQVGGAVGGAGDVNGDGFGDIFIGAPGASSPGGATGRLLIQYGSASGLPLLPGFASVGTSGGGTLVDGKVIGGSFGTSACPAGDVNGDGYADVAIGAPYEDTYAADGGGLYVFRGTAAGLDTATASLLATLQSGLPNSRTGLTLDPAGDVNGDGRGDLLIGQNGNHIIATAYLGSLVVEGALAYDATVAAGATAGDVDGDGLSDLVFGDPVFTNGQSGEGRLAFHRGAGDPPSTFPDWNATQTVLDNANLGWSVASAGDVNADGFDDVLVGAQSWYDYSTPGAFDNGLVMLYLGTASGPSTSYAWYAFGSNGDQLGISVAGPGDVNGDGYADILVGAHQPLTGGTGVARLWYGGPGGPAFGAASVTLTGYSATSYFGGSVAGAGDVNGDGYPDVVVGASHDETPAPVTYTDEGRAFLYLGGPGGLSTTPAWIAAGGQIDAHFGSVVTGAGDVDGDGWGDVAVAVRDWDIPGRFFTILDTGAFAVFRGGPTAPHLTLQTWFASGSLNGGAMALAHAGDVNGDGYSDVILGMANSASTLTGEGYAAVFPGSPTGISTTPLWSRYGGEAFGGFGSAVCGAGDVNGDRLSDVLVGAVFQDNGAVGDAGKAHLFAAPLTPGAPALRTFTGPGWYANLGHALANVGDVNQDGWSDLVFGMPGFSDVTWRQGLAWVHLGARGGAVRQGYFAFRLLPAARVIHPGNLTDPGSALLGANGRSAAGRTKVKLQYRVGSVPGLAAPVLTGTQATWTATGVPGSVGSAAALLQSASGLSAGAPYAWEYRALARSVWFPTGIWRSPVRNGRLETDMRVPGTWLDAPLAGTPRDLELSEARPNPARGSTTVSFALPRAGSVTLDVLDVQGRRVRTLVDGARAAGEHVTTWDGRGDEGAPVGAGIYFLRLHTVDRTMSRRVAWLR